MREFDSVAFRNRPGFSIYLSLSESIINFPLDKIADIVLKRMAIRAGFRFGAFVSEYRPLRPDAFIWKIYAADLPFSLTTTFRIVTMRPVIL